MLSYYPFYILDQRLSRRGDLQVTHEQFASRFEGRWLFNTGLSRQFDCRGPSRFSGAATTFIGRAASGTSGVDHVRLESAHAFNCEEAARSQSPRGVSALMKVVILCGGKGTRLREETEFRPKAMVPIGNWPILWHILHIYAAHGHTEFILCLGYKGEVIKDWFRNLQWMISDVRLRLGDPDGAHFYTNFVEKGWSVTMADTGQHTMTGARIKRIDSISATMKSSCSPTEMASGTSISAHR